MKGVHQTSSAGPGVACLSGLPGVVRSGRFAVAVPPERLAAAALLVRRVARGRWEVCGFPCRLSQTPPLKGALHPMRRQSPCQGPIVDESARTCWVTYYGWQG